MSAEQHWTRPGWDEAPILGEFCPTCGTAVAPVHRLLNGSVEVWFICPWCRWRCRAADVLADAEEAR